MKRRHLLLEDVSGDCNDAAGEPWTEEWAGIAPMKERSPVSPWFLGRRSGGHPDNSKALLPFANLPDVVPAVATVPSEVDLIAVQITKLSPCFAVFSLANVLSNFALVQRKIAPVRANLTRVATQIAAFRDTAVPVVTPSRLVCECGLRSSRHSASE
jgi:hypothetical protein